jgi:hypothetical protein
MPAASEKVRGAVHTARPVVERLARDDEFQKHVKNAYESARTLYDELFADGAPKAIASRIAQDRAIQDELRRTIEELREATRRARTPSKRPRKGRKTLLLAGIMIGLLYNPVTGEDTRRWLKEKLFGPEETFEYEP